MCPVRVMLEADTCSDAWSLELMPMCWRRRWRRFKRGDIIFDTQGKTASSVSKPRPVCSSCMYPALSLLFLYD